MINREDMLELTRRMTPSRNCFMRVAGAYMDEEGFDNGTFNIHFGKLSQAETKRNLELAKTIPFSRTNEELKEYSFPMDETRKKSMWPLLSAISKCQLRDDSLLSLFYEIVGENYRTDSEYSIFVFNGSYSVPAKASDGVRLEDSEEVYDFIVCSISPLEGEYEPGKPEFGFLFPAFVDRSGDRDMINIYNADPDNVQQGLMNKILGTY
ncbi:MAG: DUF4317 domain-containing protein [Eubacterium sp.]|nr:DUF4317 domain-containing protein [Eubacterium sp.]